MTSVNDERVENSAIEYGLPARFGLTKNDTRCRWANASPWFSRQ